MRAEEVAGSAMKATDHRLSQHHLKAGAGIESAQGKGAGGHALTACAVAGHGDEGAARDTKPHLPTAASAFLSAALIGHDSLPCAEWESLPFEPHLCQCDEAGSKRSWPGRPR